MRSFLARVFLVIRLLIEELSWNPKSRVECPATVENRRKDGLLYLGDRVEVNGKRDPLPIAPVLEDVNTARVISILGASGYSKTVEALLQAIQRIRDTKCVGPLIWIDGKSTTSEIWRTLKEEADKAGRPFHFITSQAGMWSNTLPLFGNLRKTIPTDIGRGEQLAVLTGTNGVKEPYFKSQNETRAADLFASGVGGCDEALRLLSDSEFFGGDSKIQTHAEHLRAELWKLSLVKSLNCREGIDIVEALRENAVIYVHAPPVGSTSPAVGAMVTQLVADAAKIVNGELAEEDKRPVDLVLDEFQVFVKSASYINLLIEQGRAFRLRLVFIHQDKGQLDLINRDLWAPLRNVPVSLILGSPDAETREAILREAGDQEIHQFDHDGRFSGIALLPRVSAKLWHFLEEKRGEGYALLRISRSSMQNPVWSVIKIPYPFSEETYKKRLRGGWPKEGEIPGAIWLPPDPENPEDYKPEPDPKPKPKPTLDPALRAIALGEGS